MVQGNIPKLVNGRLDSIRWTGDSWGGLVWVCDHCGATGAGAVKPMVRDADAHRCLSITSCTTQQDRQVESEGSCKFDR